jgi:hypothetical protein
LISISASATRRKGLEIDHCPDHTRLNNCCGNLVLRTRGEHQRRHNALRKKLTPEQLAEGREVAAREKHDAQERRKRRTPTSGIRGVYWDKRYQKWEARITEGGAAK